MEKLFFMVFMVFFVVVFVSGCLASTGTTTTTRTTLAAAATATTFAVEETPTTLKFVSSLPFEVDDCGKLAGDDDKILCFTRRAIKQNNVSLCERISGTTHLESGSAAECRRLVANASNMCYGLYGSLDEDECYAHLGTVFSDASYCGIIIDRTLAVSCYSDVGMAEKNVSLCDRVVGDDAEKAFCVAVAGNSPRLCDEVGGRRDECYLRISAEWGDASSCSRLEDDASMIQCLWDTAVKTRDPSVCDTVEPKIKDECYEYVAENLEDSSICGSIIGEDVRNTCYLNTGDCGKIEGGVEGAPEGAAGADWCYVMLARETGSLPACENVRDINLKYECYQYVALKTGDETPCKRITTDTGLRKKCLDQLAYVKSS